MRYDWVIVLQCISVYYVTTCVSKVQSQQIITSACSHDPQVRGVQVTNNAQKKHEANCVITS